MAVLNELLEYQKVDAELRKIEQEIAASDTRKKYVQAKKFLEVAASKLPAQDEHAVELRRLAQTLTERYREIKESIEEYSDLGEETEDGSEIAFYKRSAQALADSLRALKGEISKLTSEIASACEEYKKMKEQTIAMQRQFKEYSAAFKKLKESRAAEIEALTARLDEIGKKIPKETLEKYKTKRKERIFPVIVPLTSGRCVCGMDFPIAQQSALSGGNVIECEHCHRFIYKE